MGQLNWKMLSNPHQQAEVSSSHALRVKIENSRVILRRNISKPFEIELSRSVGIASLRSATGNVFAGVLALRGDDGSWTQTSSDNSGLHNRGLEVNNSSQNDEFLGLALRNIAEKSTLLVTPTVDAVLELRLDGSELVQATLGQDQMTYTANLERESQKILKGLDANWTLRIEIDFLWEQIPRMGISGATSAPQPTIRRSISIPLTPNFESNAE
jgi:hypothetical protein